MYLGRKCLTSGQADLQNTRLGLPYQPRAAIRLPSSLDSTDMTLSTILELPPFDTGQYEGCEFNMARGNATLTIHLAELPVFKIEFGRVRWHRYTQLHNCPVSWIQQAYFRLVEISPIESLAQYVASDTSVTKPYAELHHYRIFLDETGCHEVFSESALAL